MLAASSRRLRNLIGKLGVDIFLTSCYIIWYHDGEGGTADSVRDQVGGELNNNGNFVQFVLFFDVS